MITFTLISQDASWAELLSCSMLSFLIHLKSLHHVHTNAQMILQKQILPTVLSNNEGKKRGVQVLIIVCTFIYGKYYAHLR